MPFWYSAYCARLLVLPYHGQVRLHSRPILLRLLRAHGKKNDHTYQKDDADRRDTPKQTRTHILSSLRNKIVPASLPAGCLYYSKRD